jgi:hypothetical protein
LTEDLPIVSALFDYQDLIVFLDKKEQGLEKEKNIVRCLSGRIPIKVSG